MRKQVQTAHGELSFNQWLQPQAWEEVVKGAGSLASALLAIKKLQERFSKRRNRKKKPGREVSEEDLLAVLSVIQKQGLLVGKVVHNLGQLVTSQRRLVTALGDEGSNGSFVSVRSNVTKITKLVLAHEARLKALEKSMPN